MTVETGMSLAVAKKCPKVEIDGDDWTWIGKVFQTMRAATGNERQPIAVRWYDGTSS